jgi:hypothetical protein
LAQDPRPQQTADVIGPERGAAISANAHSRLAPGCL